MMSDNLSKASARIEEAHLKQTARLDLSDLSLTEVPESLRQLRQLQSLDLSGNQLKAIPDFLGELSQLINLSLSRNQLSVLPEFVGQLRKLQSLAISNNELGRLPQSIGLLTQLQKLYCDSNKLSTLPESIDRLTNLKFLFLDRNQLTNLPESIGYLADLQLLHVPYNQLTTLPESMGQLSRLKVLYVHNNQLTSLFDSIAHLSQLRILDVHSNQLIEVTDSIGRSIRLQNLNLSDNRLMTLPESLRTISSLEALYLHGNDALGLPIEVLGPTWQQVFERKAHPLKPSEILDYYFRVRSGQRPLNEAKLILVGRGAVGKTSIVNRLVHDYFDKGEKKTDGIRITEWNLQLNGKEDVRLNIWDFGGQEIMHATHQFFLSQRSVYLLVLNGRAGGEDLDAEYWLKLIESFGGDSPVIIVLNRIREQPFDLNRLALQRKYPAIRDFIKTDCEDATGLEQLRRTIARETDRLEHLRDAFPASWFAIKDQLASMKKNYLGFDEYRQFCELHGETDKKAQEDLAGYLHSLGVVLNYKEDPRLQDTYVLNPHWVTNGMYRILNSEILERQRGEIHLSNLSEILDSADYPASLRRFIIDLMKKFDLCFSFVDEDTHYLIPELLGKQEPEEVGEFKPAECLNFQYHYPVSLEGLLPRFIVRTHILSENLPRWRTGVILKFEGCRALVRADIPDKRVFISVSGPASARRRLLAVIRSDFERIHRDIRNLQPAEMVPVPNYPCAVVPYGKLLAMEQCAISKFPEYAEGKVIEVNVQELLNGVDLEGSRKSVRALDELTHAIRLFYSYAHKDESLRNELETHLKLLQRQGLIETWQDRKIEAGDDWKQRIDERLERADIILLLVSSDFIASDYCYDKEMTRALQRELAGEARVIPIIVRDVNWRNAPFANLQVLPKDGLAVIKWADKDSAWRSVSEGIEKIVEELRKTSDQSS
jgi:internalin A